MRRVRPWAVKLQRRHLQTAVLEKYAMRQARRKTINALQQPAVVTRELLFESANFVREELPIRLAHRIIEMQQLPYGILTTRSLFRVYQLYSEAFSACTEFPAIADEDVETEFSNLLGTLVAGSSEVVHHVSVGVRNAVYKGRRLRLFEELRLQDWIESLLTSRVGRRVLAEQHIALHSCFHGQNKTPESTTDIGFSGVIDLQCDVRQCITRAIDACTKVCRGNYEIAPNVHLSGQENVYLPFISAHLEYIVFELLKNGMRASVEHHCRRGGTIRTNKTIPPLSIFIAEGPSEVTIRISDAGGGISADAQKNMFLYGYTTVNNEDYEDSNDNAHDKKPLGNVLSERGNVAKASPMAGLGFGLPLSRLYARYFGGDVKVVSLGGYGTDVYVQLDRTGDVLEKIEI